MSKYRQDASKALARAKEELATNDDQRLKYAALELRMTMEDITYDRAVAFKDEFPESEYDTWQPKKVMAVLLEIDHYADKDSSLAIGIEDTPGVPATHMETLGSEKVLNMTTIKGHYDALGSYLHVQTIKQLKSLKTLDYAKIRKRCEDIAAYCEQVLASSVFNVMFNVYGEIECCGQKIRKRMPHGVEKVTANCSKCGARYDVVDIGNDKIEFQRQQTELKCQGPSCETTIWPNSHEVKIGRAWTCETCHGRNRLVLGVAYEPPSSSTPQAQELPQPNGA